MKCKHKNRQRNAFKDNNGFYSFCVDCGQAFTEEADKSFAKEDWKDHEYVVDRGETR